MGGILVGSLMQPIPDYFGRRRAIYIAYIVTVIGIILQAASQNAQCSSLPESLLALVQLLVTERLPLCSASFCRRVIARMTSVSSSPATTLEA